MSLELSIGILAWHSGDTLRKTLDTYVKNGLYDITNDIAILFQEATNEDISIAEEYGLPCICKPNNIGIGQGFLELAKRANYKYFLPLEHDWHLIENHVELFLWEGIQLLEAEKPYSCVRYRHKFDYGNPHFSLKYMGKELDYFDPEIKLTSPHLLDCVHWTIDPCQFPQIHPIFVGTAHHRAMLIGPIILVYSNEIFI
jgi:hypothetical protein